MLDLFPPRRSSAPAQPSEPGSNNAPAFTGSRGSKFAGRWLVVIFCLVVWAGVMLAVMMR